MAACSDTGEAGKPDPNSVTERANELFEKLAHTGRVKAEPPRFVHELKKALERRWRVDTHQNPSDNISAFRRRTLDSTSRLRQGRLSADTCIANMDNRQKIKSESSQNRVLSGTRFRINGPHDSRPVPSRGLRRLSHQRRSRTTDRRNPSLWVCHALSCKRSNDSMAFAGLPTRIIHKRSSNRPSCSSAKITWRPAATGCSRRDESPRRTQVENDYTPRSYETAIPLHTLPSLRPYTIHEASNSLRSSQPSGDLPVYQQARLLDEMPCLPRGCSSTPRCFDTHTAAKSTMH